MASERWKNEERSGRGELITRRDGAKRRVVTLAFLRVRPCLPPARAEPIFSGRHRPRLELQSLAAGKRGIWVFPRMQAAGVGGGVGWGGLQLRSLARRGCRINPSLHPVGLVGQKKRQPIAP
jgi:hypothetical protein